MYWWVEILVKYKHLENWYMHWYIYIYMRIDIWSVIREHLTQFSLVPVIPGGYPEVIIKKIEEEKKKRKKLDEVVCYLLWSL